MLKNGLNLSEITEWLRKKYAISARIIPATDDVVETNIVTKEGEMHLQEYWVRNRAQPAVIGIKYKGANRATVNPRVVTALKRSKTIIVAPANPITSIGPILAIRGMKKLLATQKHKVVAISPIVGDSAVSGPATKYMTALSIENSPYGVAKYYSKFIDGFVISKSDGLISQKIRSLNLNVYETDIIMKNNEAEKRLASYLLNLPKNV
jgi:LPPG:FO 2-phospho-L-lactate transferase